MGIIKLDGKTGEGGGQLVRVAIGLAALTTQPVTITDVRGNRPGARGGGLKSQHVTAIRFLADVTDAQVEGLEVGSKTITFKPRLSPTALTKRTIQVAAESGAASTLLVLQAMLPYLVFASNDDGSPIEMEIVGGTNVSWSLSYEYFDQILMPTLEERFGIQIERQLKTRAWSLGTLNPGLIWLKIHPVPKGKSLLYNPPKQYSYPSSYKAQKIDVTIITPFHSHNKLQQHLVSNIATLFPDSDVHFKFTEDSGQDSRWYILLVAHSVDGLRWGRDLLCSMPKATRSRDKFILQISNKLCKELYDEVVGHGGQVDEFLQDQIIAFQALADGVSSFPRGEYPEDASAIEPLIDSSGSVNLSDVRKDKTHEPFGHGSLHTQTARWVVSELIPRASFYSKGNLVKGAGFTIS